MKKYIMTVEEALNCSTVSSSTRLPISPRGGIYFGGTHLNYSEDNTYVHAFSGPIASKRIVRLLLDENGKVYSEDVNTYNLEASSLGTSNESVRATTFEALVKRYSSLSSQANLRFIGHISISVEIFNEDRSFERAIKRVDITSLEDFMTVLNHIIQVRPEASENVDTEVEASVANLERCYSALKI